MMKQKLHKYVFSEIKNYTLILFGAVIISFAYVLFLAPHKISAGGVGGIAITIYHLFKIPLGWSIFIINVPLFILGVKFLGKLYGLRTLVGIVSVSFFVDLFDGKYLPFIKIQSFDVDILIAALFGGLLLGAGIGIQFRAKGSGGGTDIIAQILGKHTSFTPGMVFLVVDSIIIVSSGIILGLTDKTGGGNRFELIFYSLIILYISSRTVDLVLEGLSTSKEVRIISYKNSEILNFIHNSMNRGATLINAVGTYKKEDRKIIYCVITKKEVTQLRDHIARIDKDAFMVVTNAYQVLGYGFHRFNQYL